MSYWFDVLRSDRSISSHGLEARTPFLDANCIIITYTALFVTYVINVKILLRKAFDNGLLPKEVLENKTLRWC